MRKHIPSTLIAIFLTIPLCGYFIVNGYLWLFSGYAPDESRMLAAFAFGTCASVVNIIMFLEEGL